MVFCVNPLIILLKLAELTVFCKTLFERVGLGEVLQQTPQSVTVVLPLKVTAPPLFAEEVVIKLTGEVVTVGTTIVSVVKVS
jgi:hypothetical protein